MADRWIQDAAALIQAIAIAMAGGWALFIYRRRRQGQVGLGLEISARMVHDWNPGKSVLLVKLLIQNTSNVVYWHREATAILMDARKEAMDGGVRLVPFMRVDPMPPVYGDINADVLAAKRGELFHLGTSQISLEPGESLQSEVPFVLDSGKLGLLGLRVLVQGQQRRRIRPKDYWWGAFVYLPAGSEAVGSVEERK
jgi:hypothetical protein